MKQPVPPISPSAAPGGSAAVDDEERMEILPGSEDPDFLDLPEPHLTALEGAFHDALEMHRKGKRDACLVALKDILRREPRLAEPRLEMASLYLEMGRLDDAEAEAREGLRILDAGGQWTLDIPDNVLLAHACDLLAETLRQKLGEDDVIFGDADAYQQITAETRSLYQRALELNPNDEDADYYAAFMGKGPAEA